MDAPRLDQETVERLLDGSPYGAPAAPPVLVRFLGAVRAAPRPAELDGESAALAEFRAARAAASAAGSTADLADHQPTAASARRQPAGAGGGADDRPARRFATLLGAKVAVAALAATLTGGVALAAATGNLPGDTRGEAPPAGPTTAGAPATTGSAPTAHPTHPATGPTAGAPDLSSPAGLCVAYRAVGEGGRGRALAAPAFAGLVAAAGGPARVPGYCAGLLHGSDSPGAGEADRTGPPTGGVPDPGTGGPPSGAAPASGAARTPNGPPSRAARTPGAGRSPAGHRSGPARPPAGGVPEQGGPPTG
ncbi:hypothetical protein [Micromonospora sp. NPDC049282]|uniref:hypothetical protein n=1 Tax=Micromonospora sp. NPDC049282 TaxID=3364269 RepID=UPI0037174070